MITLREIHARNTAAHFPTTVYKIVDDLRLVFGDDLVVKYHKILQILVREISRFREFVEVVKDRVGEAIALNSLLYIKLKGRTELDFTNIYYDLSI
jgi:hypothetical protein